MFQHRYGKLLAGVSLPASMVLVTLTASVGAADEEADMGAGTEDRDWVTEVEDDPTSPERFDFETEENVKIEMRDGVLLDALVYLPDVDETPACILIADGYGWSYDSRDQRFAERGYSVVNVSMRGVDARGSSGENASEGEQGLYNEMARDGYDIIEWMADQDWCNGNVGAFGSSLPGIPLWQIAREEPPSLKAIAPDVACGDCYEYLWYPGGMLPGPGRVGRGDPEYSSAQAHRDRDEFWEEQSTDAEDHATIAESGIGVLATGGWEDYITAGNVQAFDEFASAGGDGRLLMAPGAHFSSRSSVLGPHHHEQHMDLFFDHFLRGEDNQWRDDEVYKGDALIYVHGADAYRWEETWPIPDARQAQLHLREAETGSVDSLNDGSLTAAGPGADEAGVGYSYDPEDGPFLRTMRESGGGVTTVNQQPYEEEVLTWTTGELEHPTEVTGKYALEFFASADTEDTDFVLMVSDVAPDGTSRYVTSGYLNAPRNESRAEPDPLEPGEVRQYQMDTQAISHVFKEGHRIRFSLAGGTTAAPEQSSPQGPGKNPNPANVTIYQDAERPATVELPVIGTAVLPSELESKSECKNGAWEGFGFGNQGQCIRYVNTGQDSR